ncbi:MAG: M23 family metallopeptidase [Candidatus Omnitrophota bacterium]|nr:MAG: M23 family metallopeptidase [Candidatus Omnitrophota bacterium]
MKNAVKLFLAICFVGISLFVIQNFLFPLVYTIKEPLFAMPIRAERLPIRNDAHGNGEFGAKRKNGRMHNGVDLAAGINSPVYASKSGWARACYIPGGYGNLVVIKHPGKWQTRYGHLNKTTIKKLQWIRQGAIIGFVGKTGNANQKNIIPHLHFEIRYKGEPLDPATFLLSLRDKVYSLSPLGRGQG